MTNYHASIAHVVRGAAERLRLRDPGRQLKSHRALPCCTRYRGGSLP